MRTADFDERTTDCDYDESNERTRTAPRRSRHEFTYARKTKRTSCECFRSEAVVVAIVDHDLIERRDARQAGCNGYARARIQHLVVACGSDAPDVGDEVLRPEVDEICPSSCNFDSPVDSGDRLDPSTKQTITEPDLYKNILVYFGLVLGVFVASWLLVVAIEPDATWADAGMPLQDKLIDSASAVVATLNNIGPGLGVVGATENYAEFQWGTKLLFVVLMMLGRLEFFSILVLMIPSFWRRGP